MCGEERTGDPQERKPCSVAPPFQVKTATRITVTPGLKSFQRSDHSFQCSGSCWCRRFSPVFSLHLQTWERRLARMRLSAPTVWIEESKVHGSQTSSHLACWNGGRRAKVSRHFRLNLHMFFWIWFFSPWSLTQARKRFFFFFFKSMITEALQPVTQGDWLPLGWLNTSDYFTPVKFSGSWLLSRI